MISLIIPTKDRVPILEQTIMHAKEALASYDNEIIVVNDAEQKLNLPSDLNKELIITRNPKQGVASARNYGASLAQGEWLLFLDDDMLIHATNIEEVLLLAQNQPNACYNINWEYPEKLKSDLSKLQFGRYLNFYGFSSMKGWNKDNSWSDDHAFETNGITSQFFFIRSSLFWDIGGYNESFPFAGFEDYDLTQRIKRNNTRIYIQPNTIAYHNEMDRSNVELWLERKKRGGKTRQVAVGLGYSELTLTYGEFKSRVYNLVFFCKRLFFRLLKLMPNIKVFDRFYFFFVNLLYGAYVYKGYKDVVK